MSFVRDGLAPRISTGDSSFRSKMLKIAAEMNNVIAMGRGDPDFNTPDHIMKAAKDAIDARHHHYTDVTGLFALREAICIDLNKRYSLDYRSDEIIVTAGVQESITLCMLGLVSAGDEVLITSPRFTTYDTAVELAGGVPVPVHTWEENDFALNVAEIEKCITPRTKMFVVVSPNNPTGAVTPPYVIRQIAELAIRHNLIIVADEIYSRLVYEGSEHLSLASLPGMKERTITLNGFSKTFAMTGWRVGYLAAPADFVERMQEPRHTLSINTCTISQYAALAALNGPQEPVYRMFAEYAERRAFLMPALTDMGLTYGHPGGAFYIYTNVSSTGIPSPEFCEKLLRHTGVLIFAGVMFGDPTDKYIRISYLQPLEQIKLAMERMRGFIAASSR